MHNLEISVVDGFETVVNPFIMSVPKMPIELLGNDSGREVYLIF